MKAVDIGNLHRGIIDALKNIISEIPPAQQWISCRNIDKLPDNEVLCCDKYGEEMIGYLAYDDNGELVCAFEDMIMTEPIAWMHLPEPYKEKEQ